MNPRIVCIASVLALTLVGCGGGTTGINLPVQRPNPVQPIAGSQARAGFSWGAKYLTGATLLHPANFTSMAFHVVVNLRDEAGLLNYARQVSDPHSALYRHFLTPQEIGARFGASDGDNQAVIDYLRKNNLSVGTWSQHLVLAVSGKQADVERAFGTTFGVWSRQGKTFIAPLSQPHVAVSLPVSSITGFIMKPAPPTPRVSLFEWAFSGYSVQQMANGYDYSGAWGSGFDGTGITIGIVADGVIDPRDVPNYGKLFSARVANTTQVPVLAQPASALNNNTGTAAVDPNPGGLASPPPVTDMCASPVVTATCNAEDGEAQLDSEQVAAFAPGATVHSYLAYNTQDCAIFAPAVPNCIGVEGFGDDEIQQIIADDTADVVSYSFQIGETDCEAIGCFNASGTGPQPDEYAALAAEGIAVFVSSGDNGAESCSDLTTGAPIAAPCVSYPASDPSVVSVGGVNAPLDETGNLIAPITSWGHGGDGMQDNSAGSAGGVSQVFAAPPWQASAVSATMREVPDISLDADPLTGPALLIDSAFPDATVTPSGGTSGSSPEAAAMWALVLNACKSSPTCATASGAHPYRLGNPAPLLYAIYTGKPSGQFTAKASYSNVFYDVVYGMNNAEPTPSAPPVPGCCSTGVGYDEVTGIGVPFAGHLIQAVTGTNVP